MTDIAPTVPGLDAYDFELDPHPANKLDQGRFTHFAWFAAQQLDEIGFSYVDLQPGDGTAYQVAIIRPPMISQWDRWQQAKHVGPDHPAYLRHCGFNDQSRYFVAHSIGGQLYGWGGIPMHWDYVHAKWTRGNATTDTWTARVIGRFLTTLAHQITLREAVNRESS